MKRVLCLLLLLGCSTGCLAVDEFMDESGIYDTWAGPAPVLQDAPSCTAVTQAAASVPVQTAEPPR